MQIDYEKLASIATDPTSRTTMAKDTSEVLASYMQILSNLIFAAERLSESEMAMIISSLNRWVTKKDISVKRAYTVGTIVQMEWGNNFSPELSYKHPAVIIEEWTNTVLVIQPPVHPQKWLPHIIQLIIRLVNGTIVKLASLKALHMTVL